MRENVKLVVVLPTVQLSAAHMTDFHRTSNIFSGVRILVLPGHLSMACAHWCEFVLQYNSKVRLGRGFTLDELKVRGNELPEHLGI